MHVWYAGYNSEFEEMEWRFETWVDWDIEVIEEEWIVICYGITQGVSYGGA